MEEVYSSHQIRSSVYEGYLQQLISWAEALPVNLGLLLQVGSPGASTGMPRETFGEDGVGGITNPSYWYSVLTEGDKLNTRLAFLTVKILLSRPLLIRSVMETRGQSDRPSDTPIAASMTAKFTDIWWARSLVKRNSIC
jgi:hypothetical protein